jgi:hypothetical protein
MSSKVGYVQRAFMAQLRLKSSWQRERHTWTWEGAGKTEALLKSLEPRGLVRLDQETDTWTLTQRGLQSVEREIQYAESCAEHSRKRQEERRKDEERNAQRKREQEAADAAAWPVMLQRIREASDSDLRHLMDLASTGYNVSELLEKWEGS